MSHWSRILRRCQAAPKLFFYRLRTRRILAHSADARHRSPSEFSDSKNPVNKSIKFPVALPENSRQIEKKLEIGFSNWTIPEYVSTLDDLSAAVDHTQSVFEFQRNGLDVTGLRYLLFSINVKTNQSFSLNLTVSDTVSQEQLPKIDVQDTNIDGAGGKVLALFSSFAQTKQIDAHLAVYGLHEEDKITLTVSSPAVNQVIKKQKSASSGLGTIIASIATMPSRERTLEDTIVSLHEQVDEIRVFLNNYDKIPDYFRHYPKLVCETSQNHGDLGDAGKFFWAGDGITGYRFVCDDDIVYPPNYVETVISKMKQYNNQAVLSAHGILLRQPVTEYYRKGRAITYNFSTELDKDIYCHILGTGVMAYHTDGIQLSLTDFEIPNMADVWLSRAAQQQNIPLVCYSRPEDWIFTREVVQQDSIFQHSRGRNKGKLNTGAVQTEVLNKLYPISTKFTSSRPRPNKLFLGISVFNEDLLIRECVESYLNTRNNVENWVVAIANLHPYEKTMHYLKSVKIPSELFILERSGENPVAIANEFLQLAKDSGADSGLLVTDDMIFHKSGWDSIYKTLADRKVALGDAVSQKENSFDESIFVKASAQKHCLFSKDILKLVGGFDQESFNSYSLALADFNLRSRRAGFPLEELWPDSSDFLCTQSSIESFIIKFVTTKTYRKNMKLEPSPKQDRIFRDSSRTHVAISS